MEIRSRPILMKTAYVGIGAYFRSRRQTKENMICVSDTPNQYETFQKITPVSGEIKKPRHLGAKEDQSLIPYVVLRSTGYRKKIEKYP